MVGQLLVFVSPSQRGRAARVVPRCVGAHPAVSVLSSAAPRALLPIEVLPVPKNNNLLSEASRACAGKEGQPCLFPRNGTYLLRGWHERSMTCMPLPDRPSDELFCARPILEESDAGLGHRREEEALNSTTSNSSTSKVMVVKCPIGACDSNNTCRQNRTGPVCGFCKPGYSMNANGCSAQPCPAEEELHTLRWLVGVVFSVLFLAAYLALALRPVLPELDWLLARLTQGLVSLLSNVLCYQDVNKDVGGGVLEVIRIGKWLISKFSALRTLSQMSARLSILSPHVHPWHF